MKKLLRSLGFILICLIVVLTACHTSTGPTSKEQDSQKSENEISNNVSGQQDGEQQGTTGEGRVEAPTGDLGYELASIVRALAVTEKGYYFIANETMFFYDIASGVSIPMCSRTECSHGGYSSCDAYAEKNDIRGITCTCEGQEIFYYGDSLYMVECDLDNNYYLCRYNSSFNNKERLVHLTSYAEDKYIVADEGAYTISDGYFYYYKFPYDSKLSIKGNYTVEVSCMRVKMEEGAMPEQLGKFDWAGDYDEAAGYGNGTVVYALAEDIYYIAGAYGRFWTTTDDMQYRIAKYSVNTKEFVILDSYTGERNKDAWGTGVGLLRFTGNNSCMSEDGTIYVIVRGEEDGIAAVNVKTNVRKKIYTTPYDLVGVEYSSFELTNLAYDGTYLYFIEAEPNKATYLTAVDVEGNVKRRYKFEYSEKYKAELVKYNRDSIITGGLELLGVSNGNILVKSTQDVYKDLSSTRGNLINYKEYGVGIISVSDFLGNKDVEIKQIYQY